MRIHPKRFQRPVDTTPQYKANAQITAPEIRLIDENGANVGVMPIAKALEMAEAKGFDLVEVFPAANPPVCKILNFGQFKYEKEREERKKKSQAKTVEVKGIRLSSRIGDHDMETRLTTAKKFLDENNKVRVEIILRGREKAFAHVGRQVIEEFLNKLKVTHPLNVEQPVQFANGQLTTIVGKK